MRGKAPSWTHRNDEKDRFNLKTPVITEKPPATRVEGNQVRQGGSVSDGLNHSLFQEKTSYAGYRAT